MSDRPPSIHPSRRDTWLVLVLLGSVAAMVWAAGMIWHEEGSLAVRAGTVAAMGVVAAGVLWVTFGTGYRLEDGGLFVRSGPFRWRVPYGDILAARRSRNPLSGPAMSLRRLELELRGRAWPLLVSPMDRGRFLRELAERADGLVEAEEGLERRRSGKVDDEGGGG